MYIEPPKIKDFNVTNPDHKPELSIIMPGIQPKNWTTIYNSIVASTSRSFELIIITNGESGDAPKWLKEAPNIKIMYDFGSPVRAQCIGHTAAEGRIITWMADDGLFIPYGLESAIDRFYEMEENKKNVLVYKYSESHKTYTDEYFKINFHRGPAGEGIGSDYIPDDYYIFNTPIMYREFYEEMGGLNCSYECTAIAHLEFGIRAQHAGAVVELLKGIPILACDQSEPEEGSHSFVHDAQTTHDEPLYSGIFKQPDWQEKVQIKLDYSREWKKSSTAWSRKYKEYLRDFDYAYASIRMFAHPPMSADLATTIKTEKSDKE
tara:strand:+ start:439 stop:1398 length:960 start_codon:yes stop_codon:yes gene_type:complete